MKSIRQLSTDRTTFFPSSKRRRNVHIICLDPAWAVQKETWQHLANEFYSCTMLYACIFSCNHMMTTQLHGKYAICLQMLGKPPGASPRIICHHQAICEDLGAQLCKWQRDVVQTALNSININAFTRAPLCKRNGTVIFEYSQ